jgi:hypothetical protein
MVEAVSGRAFAAMPLVRGRYASMILVAQLRSEVQRLFNRTEETRGSLKRHEGHEQAAPLSRRGPRS